MFIIKKLFYKKYTPFENSKRKRERKVGPSSSKAQKGSASEPTVTFECLVVFTYTCTVKKLKIKLFKSIINNFETK